MRPKQGELLRRWGLRLDKRLGQHFLVDPSVPDRICDAVASFDPGVVIELGPGAGALSFALLERGWPVHALELDSRMIELLTAEAAGQPLTLERRDLAQTDYVAIARERADARGLVFAGNLPYQVTSPILFGLLPALREAGVRGAVLMMQAEVATRCAAAPGGRDYGVLSVQLQAQAEVKRLFVVKPGSFLPPPAVDSAVVRLSPRRDPIELGDAGRTLVRTLFGQRRKQIGGMLRSAYGLDAEGMESATGILPTQRPEQLGPAEFLRLSEWVEARR